VIVAVSSASASYFVSGAAAVCCVAIALFFLRFWRASGDRLFAGFALGFAVFGANRVALLFARGSDAETWVYLVRLLAFLLIVAAIVDKNRQSG
jgi:hypothetical protein